MVISRDSGSKFRNTYFWPNSGLNFRKVTKSGGNWLKSKKVTGKKQNPGWTPPPPVPPVINISDSICDGTDGADSAANDDSAR